MIRTKSLCASCPLRDQKRVWSDHPEGEFRLAFFGESPGKMEVISGHPFVGPAGNYLNERLTLAHIRRAGCGVANLISCRPPNDDLSSEEGKLAVECCKPGLEEEIAFFKSHGVRVIVALGNEPTSYFTGHRGINKIRGSVFQRNDGLVVIPTFHPSGILRSGEKVIQRSENKLSSHVLGPVFTADLAKAREIADHDWHPPKENFQLRPSAEEVVATLLRLSEEKALLGVDIETLGWKPEKGEIFLVGIAWSGEDAISIPFFKQGNERYWTSEEQEEVSKTLRTCLSSCPTVFQNAKFDVNWLEAKGYPITQLSDDVMLAHHAICPDLPHDLGFIVSVYGKTPSWKEGVLSRDRPIYDVPDDELRTYNLRDAVVLLQVLPALREQLVEYNVMDMYKNISMKLIRPIIGMEKRGIRIDTKRLKDFKEELKTNGIKLESEARTIAGLYTVGTVPEVTGPKDNSETVGSAIDSAGTSATTPTSGSEPVSPETESPKLDASIPQKLGSLTSDDDLRWIIFGVEANKFKKARLELPTKKRKDTAVYRKLFDLVQLVDQVHPLFPDAKNLTRTTDSGKLSVKEDYLLGIERAATTRLGLLAKFKRPRPEHIAEREQLEKGLKFLVALRKFNENDKLLTTYTNYPIKDDGRVHCEMLEHGTATGRLAVKSPNLQNQPEDVRKIFVPEVGYTFISADYSNLELRVISFMARDDVLIRQFASGEKIHDSNAMFLFGIAPDHPQFKSFKKAAKIYRFGRNYLGSLSVIYEKVMIEVPECGLTYSRLKEADDRYMALHPRHPAWAEETKAEVNRTKRLTNAFGRIRLFFGNKHDIEKEGVNFPIQSTAADIINQTTVKLYELGAPMILQIHDALLFEVRDEEVATWVPIIKREMETEFDINGYRTRFPVEISTSTRSWWEKEMEPYTT